MHTHIRTHAYKMSAGAVWSQEGAGRIAVLGSVQVFDDKYIDKEENSKLMDFFFKWLRPVSNMHRIARMHTHTHTTLN